MKTEEIENALVTLERAGLEHIKAECRNGYPQSQAVGLAIASVHDNASYILHLAYSALEDWNYHDICAVLDWIGNLYDGIPYEQDLQRIQREIERHDVTVRTEWNPATNDYGTRRVNVRVIIEDCE